MQFSLELLAKECQLWGATTDVLNLRNKFDLPSHYLMSKTELCHINWTLTWILCKNSRKVSNQYESGLNFIVLSPSKYKIMHFISGLISFEENLKLI